MRIFTSLLLIWNLAFGRSHFSPKGPIAVWDLTNASGILNGSGTWDINSSLFNYDTLGIRNSTFCQGCNVSFGATGSTLGAGVVTVSGIQKINSFAFNFVPSGNYTLTGGEISCVNSSPCTYTANHSGTIGSVISGSKDLIKQGAQTLTLSGVNTYTGNTNVNAGTLEATTNVEAIPGNLIIAAGATGHLNVTGVKTFPNIISGSGTLKVTAGGTVAIVTTLSGNLSGLIGLFDIYPSASGGGKINLTNTTQANTPPIGSTIKLNNGATIYLSRTLNYESNFSLYGGTTGEALGQLRVENGTVTGPVTLFANSTIGTNGPTGFISGEISGGFGFTKEGSGNITLTNNNTYTGTTVISAGTLQLGDGIKTNNIIPATNLITDNAALVYNTPSTITHSGVISGTGSLNKQGNGTLTLTSNETYSGATTVNGGNLTLGAGGKLVTSGITVNNGGTMQFSGNTQSDNIGSGSMPITVNAGGLLSVTSQHSMGYNNLNNYANVTINGGTFNLTQNQYIGTLTLTDATVSGTGAVQFFFSVPTAINATTDSTISSPMNINAAAQTINVGAGATLSVSGNIGFNSGASGAITKSGTGNLIFSGTNTYTGNTTISGGTLQIGGAGSLGTGAYASAISIAGGATLQYSSSAAQTLSGLISGAGNIVKDTGTNTLSATSNNTNTGTVTINAGTFYVNYPAAVGSAITVKSGATLSLGDNGAGLNAWSAPLTFSGPDSGTNALLNLISLASLPDHTWSGTITLNTPATINTGHNVRPNYLTGVISGAGSLTFLSSGGADFTVNGINTYSGGTIISKGKVIASNDDALGSGLITMGDTNTGASNIEWSFAGGGGGNGPPNNVVTGPGTGAITIGTYSGGYTTLTGTMTFNRAVTIKDATSDRTTINGKISGNVGTLTTGPGRITFGNVGNDFVGDLSMANGSIYQNDSPTALPVTTDVTQNGNSTFRISNGGTHTINGLNGQSTDVANVVTAITATLSLGNGNGNGDYSGVIQDGGATLTLIKAGTGTQTLRGANTYTGATTVTGGTLIFSPANTSFGSTSGTTISGGGQVTLNNGAAGFNYTKNWVFSGLGGTIWFSQPGGAVNFTVSGTITLNGPGTILGNKLQTTTISGAISGGSSLTFSSPGYNNNWVITGNNTYTGGTIINTASVVRCGSQNCLGTGTVTVNAGGFLNCQNWEITNGIIDNGGTIQNCRRTYLANGNFTAPTGVTSIQYLVVAGGGGGGGRGGANVSGAGGGGGGFLTGTVAVVPGNTYAITVGAGGAQSTTNSPTRGGDSSIGALVTAIGGGGGGAGGGVGNQGASGGSGGGSVGNSLAGGAGTAGQGSIGGRGSSTNVGANVIGAGGGGGAGGAGGTGLTGSGNAPGGAGLASSYSGAAVTYAAGGTGGDYPSSTSGASGAANTGDGGDGGGGNGNANGGSGGSGIVIILPY